MTSSVNPQETREWPGKRGQLGAALVALGSLVIGRQSRTVAVGPTLVVTGVGLVAGGLVDAALGKTGTKGML